MLRALPRRCPCLVASSSTSFTPVALPQRTSSTRRPPPPSANSDNTPELELQPPRLSYASLLTSDSLQSVIDNARVRNATVSAEEIQRASELAHRRRQLQGLVSETRNRMRLVGERVRRKEEGSMEAAKELKEERLSLEAETRSVEDDLLRLALTIPNETSPQTPVGPEKDARVVDTLGPPALAADLNRDHLTVARHLGLVDFKAGSLVTGSNFYFLRGSLVFLEQALISYALNLATRHGFEASTCPDIVRTDIASRCGFLPRDRDGSSSSYHIAPVSPSSTENPRLSLAGTAEIPLAGQSYCTLYPEGILPRRTVGLGTAYRTETGGSRGARGLYRVHAFKKVELFVVCEQGRGEGEKEMEDLLSLQRQIIEGLGLTVRLLEMPSEELGASAYRKVDIEAWMPGKGEWGEISSTSNCTDYQARRLLINYRPTNIARGEERTQFAHTLNGTAAAIPRLLVALLENGVVLEAMTTEELAVDKACKVKHKKDRNVNKHVEEELEGVKVVGFKLPSALRPWWIGKDEFGGKPIEWT